MKQQMRQRIPLEEEERGRKNNKRKKKRVAALVQKDDEDLDPFFGRQWSSEEVERETKTRVVSYNVLCESAVMKYRFELYPKQTRREVHPERRMEKIAEEELKRLKPDVINLQEVEAKRFEKMKALLSKYEGHFVKKGKGKTDGVATFFRKSKFALATWSNEPMRVATGGKEKGDDGDGNAYGDGDAFGLVLVLENRKKKTALVTGNAHVLFAPKNGLVKLAQMKTILDAMEREKRRAKKELTKKHQTKAGSHHRVMKVLSLDGNFLPSSALYKFVEDGYFDKMSCNRRNMGGYLNEGDCHDDEEEKEAVGQSLNENNVQSWSRNELDADDALTYEELFNGSSITKLNRESGRMRSAYKEALKQEPEWTSCHRKFVGTTDYIFFDESAVKVKRVLKTPNVLKWNNEKRLPNMRYPSDHLSIVADFSFR